ncbi:MAG: hypothetical protein WDO73_19540 [Ignavibacteriota bacterium]
MLVPDARNALQRLPGFEALHDLRQRILALTDHHGVDEIGGESLIG